MRAFLFTSFMLCLLAVNLYSYDASDAHKRKWFFLHGGLEADTAAIGSDVLNVIGFSFGYGLGVTKDVLISVDGGVSMNSYGRGVTRTMGNLMYYVDDFSYALLGAGDCTIELGGPDDLHPCVSFGYGKHLSLGKSIEVTVSILTDSLESKGQAYIGSLRYRGFWF